VIEDTIYFQVNVSVAAWVGIGLHLGNSSDGGMTNADIYTSIWTVNGNASFSDNVTVADRWAKSVGLPGLDTTHTGCEENVINGSVSGYQDEVNEITVYYFARKLDTGDKCDWPIVSGNMKVIWAYGATNRFSKHVNQGESIFPFLNGTGTTTSSSSTSGSSTTGLTTGSDQNGLTTLAGGAIAVGSIAFAIGVVNVILAVLVWKRRRQPNYERQALLGQKE